MRPGGGRGAHRGSLLRRYRLLYPGQCKASGYGGHLSVHGRRDYHGPGAAAGGADKRYFSFVGDSTFFASGLTGIVNAIYNEASLTLCILDNSTTQ